MNKKTKILCEAALMLSLALVLDFLRLFRLPNGGAVTLSMLPLVLFAMRNGSVWGSMAGFVFGGINYMMGGTAIDWTTIFFDYFLAYSMLGFGAGLFHKRKLGCIWGSLCGGTLQFITSYLVGVFVWGKWMPENFLGMTMTSPWIYSFLYNIIWAVPDITLATGIFIVLYQLKPMRRYLSPPN
ncbi:MAG: energy-coupled thiamine transporter ThiT [Oscillospiraceae bacterium]|nr:energy-coupled thiamine transporter ThiT [Oscillospiraceae bacterium]